MTVGNQIRERWREFLQNQPMERMAKPNEVADLVMFLASERASYITGTIYILDGGISSRSG